MKIEKQVLQTTIENLTERAEDCFERAHAQHNIADTQHASAEKLAILGEELEANAITLAGEIEMAAGRTSPIMETVEVDKPAAIAAESAATLPKPVAEAVVHTEHLQQRVGECREKAAAATDQVSRQAYLSAATTWQKLADQASTAESTTPVATR